MVPAGLEFRLTLLGLIFNFTFILPVLIVFMLYTKGYITSIRIPKREERLIPFVLIAVCYTLLVFLFQQRLSSLFILSQVMIGIALTHAVATLITTKFKISIHSVAISGALGILVGVQIIMTELELLYAIASFTALLGLTMTARLQLNAHTPKQVLYGALLGFGLNLSIILLFGKP